MPLDNKLVECGACGTALEEDPSLAVENRIPCPHCGSKTRLFHVTINGKVVARPKLGMKGRHVGGGKPFVEQVSGDDLHRKTGKWMNLSRVIDRGNDLYHEVVIDSTTGEVVHECKEPLSQHRGHGATKHKGKQ